MWHSYDTVDQLCNIADWWSVAPAVTLPISGKSDSQTTEDILKFPYVLKRSTHKRCLLRSLGPLRTWRNFLTVKPPMPGPKPRDTLHRDQAIAKSAMVKKPRIHLCVIHEWEWDGDGPLPVQCLLPPQVCARDNNGSFTVQCDASTLMS